MPIIIPCSLLYVLCDAPDRKGRGFEVYQFKSDDFDTDLSKDASFITGVHGNPYILIHKDGTTVGWIIHSRFGTDQHKRRCFDSEGLNTRVSIVPAILSIEPSRFSLCWGQYHQGYSGKYREAKKGFKSHYLLPYQYAGHLTPAPSDLASPPPK
jgi:hypothetical protein